MKLVLDTNVLLAGIFTHGVCEALLDECLGSEQHELFTSQPVLDEFIEHATKKFHAPPNKAATALKVLTEQMILVVPAAIAKDACRDPDDLAVLGTLVAAQADCLVTGDKDLLTLRQWDNRPILSPRQCLQALSKLGP